jgi:hypothetical protein
MYGIIILKKLKKDEGCNWDFIFRMLFSGVQGIKMGERYREVPNAVNCCMVKKE